jgi:hypothetical protein
VEFRLYGWNAAMPFDSTHLVGASMRARFASIAGGEVDPTGQLSVNGDYFHLAGSTLAIDLGGHSAGINYDALNVTGVVELEGNLEVSLIYADALQFSPILGDSFEILTAMEGLSGSFSEVSLPMLTEGLDWSINYSAHSVSLNVVASADFNSDGNVDGDDLLVWKNHFGTFNADRANGDADHNGVVDGRDLLQWQRQVDATTNLEGKLQMSVPEPSVAALVGALTCFALPILRTYRRPNPNCICVDQCGSSWITS